MWPRSIANRVRSTDRTLIPNLQHQPIPGAHVAADIQSIHSAASQRRDAQHAEAAGQEFLVFTLGAEEYGIDILKVQEIRGYDNVTRIANAPTFIKGVINLRGIIVPIVDMRIKFNLGRVEYDNQTVVIILNVAHRVVGMVVDGVSDVLTLTAEQVMPAPEFGATLTTEYLTGLGTVDGRMLILMDIEKLMTSKEMELIELVGV
ncbi:chemotaxis protein CheW [Caballeronia humi]|uniref:Chemotaxis protein CheW n=1 Tax=Caballeronia humi TaxID=326474 RepID=A0A158IJQ8_9BURK|nr:chemotaxis protein CheW [Caballeronia humi]